MYLFQKAKDTIVKTLQSDKNSPVAKLTSVCKFILKNAFVLSFSFLVLITYTYYTTQDLQNKELLKIITALVTTLGLLSFIILKRVNGCYTLAKIKLYPFSIKDLVDISLSTGTLTISIIDISLGYIYLMVAFALFVISSYSAYESVQNPKMMDNENINAFTLQFTSVLYMGLYIISQIGIFRVMPYHPLEYITFIIKNIGDDVISSCKKVWKFVF